LPQPAVPAALSVLQSSKVIKYSQDTSRSEELKSLLQAITGTSSHGLRRGVITTAFRMGCNPAEVMQISGHRSISSLLEYNDADLFNANGITTVL